MFSQKSRQIALLFTLTLTLLFSAGCERTPDPSSTDTEVKKITGQDTPQETLKKSYQALLLDDFKAYKESVIFINGVNAALEANFKKRRAEIEFYKAFIKKYPEADWKVLGDVQLSEMKLKARVPTKTPSANKTPKLPAPPSEPTTAITATEATEGSAEAPLEENKTELESFFDYPVTSLDQITSVQIIKRGSNATFLNPTTHQRENLLQEKGVWFYLPRSMQLLQDQPPAKRLTASENIARKYEAETKAMQIMQRQIESNTGEVVPVLALRKQMAEKFAEERQKLGLHIAPTDERNSSCGHGCGH